MCDETGPETMALATDQAVERWWANVGVARLAQLTMERDARARARAIVATPTQVTQATQATPPVHPTDC